MCSLSTVPEPYYIYCRHEEKERMEGGVGELNTVSLEGLSC